MAHLLSGTYGYWTVIDRAENDIAGRTMWNCICKCGSKRKVIGSNLYKGRTISCGCFSAEKSKIMKTTHNMSKTKIYEIWQSMIRRCYDENFVFSKNYIKNNIKVCDRWLTSFDNFYEDMGDFPIGKVTLDRIDPLKDYCKENCRWLSKKEQNDNKTNTLWIEYNGEKRTLKEWSIILNIPRMRLYNRIYLNKWSIEDAFTKPKIIKRGKNKPKEVKKYIYYQSSHAVSIALKSGKLIKPSKCEIKNCEETKLEAHHYLGYKKENWLDVQWLCKKHHKKDNEFYIEFNGKKQTITDWSKEFNISKHTIKIRLIKNNYIVSEEIFSPIKSKSKFLTFNGETLNISGWSKKLGMSMNAIKNRLNNGWSIEKTLSEPPQSVARNKTIN